MKDILISLIIFLSNPDSVVVRYNNFSNKNYFLTYNKNGLLMEVIKRKSKKKIMEKGTVCLIKDKKKNPIFQGWHTHLGCLRSFDNFYNLAVFDTLYFMKNTEGSFSVPFYISKFCIKDLKHLEDSIYFEFHDPVRSIGNHHKYYNLNGMTFHLLVKK